MNSTPPVENVASLADAGKKLGGLARLRAYAVGLAIFLLFSGSIIAFGAQKHFLVICYLVVCTTVVAAVVCFFAAAQRVKAEGLRQIFGLDRVVISGHTPSPEQPRRAAAMASVALARAAAAARRAAAVLASQLGCLAVVLAARLLPAPARARA